MHCQSSWDLPCGPTVLFHFHVTTVLILQLLTYITVLTAYSKSKCITLPTTIVGLSIPLFISFTICSMCFEVVFLGIYQHKLTKFNNAPCLKSLLSLLHSCIHRLISCLQSILCSMLLFSILYFINLDIL